VPKREEGVVGESGGGERGKIREGKTEI